MGGGRTLRLDQKSRNNDEGRPIVKMLAKCRYKGTYNTQTWPMHGNMIANKVKVNLEVFGALMLDEVYGHIDDTNIVAEHNRSMRS
jgi:hypothetical protein